MATEFLGTKLTRIVFMALFAGGVGACSSAQDIEPVYELNGARQPVTSKDFRQSGIDHLKAGRFGLALHDLRRALQENPESVSTLNAIAIGYDELQRFDLSRRYYIKSLALDPNSVQTLNNFGNSLLRQRKVQEALAYFERAQTIAERNETIRTNLETAKKRLERTAPASSSEENVAVEEEILPDIEEPKTTWIERTSPHIQTLVTNDVQENDGDEVPADVRQSDVSFRHVDPADEGDGDALPSVTTPMVMSRSSYGPPLLLDPSRIEKEAARLVRQALFEKSGDAPVFRGDNAAAEPQAFSAPPVEKPVRMAALTMAPILNDDGKEIGDAVRTRASEAVALPVVSDAAISSQPDPAPIYPVTVAMAPALNVDSVLMEEAMRTRSTKAVSENVVDIDALDPPIFEGDLADVQMEETPVVHRYSRETLLTFKWKKRRLSVFL